MSKQFDALAILNRASELGIEITLADDNLRVKADASVLKPNVVERIREYKSEIISYLRALDAPPICATCLDAGLETVALPEAYEDVMYCAEHHPGQQPSTVSPPQGTNTVLSEQLPSAVEKAKQHPVVQALLERFGGELKELPAGFSSTAEYIAHQKQELQRPKFGYKPSYSTGKTAINSRQKKHQKEARTLATSGFMLDK